jgi:hypothetical protein
VQLFLRTSSREYSGSSPKSVQVTSPTTVFVCCMSTSTTTTTECVTCHRNKDETKQGCRVSTLWQNRNSSYRGNE